MTTDLIRFAAAGQTFGVDMRQVVGVERADRLQPAPPNAPPTVAGLLPRRGECPVARLADRLGLPATASKDTARVLILEVAAGRFGLLVDRVFPVYRADRNQLQPLPSTTGPLAASLCDGVFLLDGQAVLMLNAAALHPDAINSEAPFEESVESLSQNPERSTRLVVLGLPAARTNRPIGFGLPGNQVVEVAEAPAVTTVPGTPRWAGGLFPWRGRAIPLLDLAAWVGLSPHSVSHRRVVIARTSQPGQRVGLLAGEVVRVLNLPIVHIPSRRELSLDRTRVKGVFELPGVTMILPVL